MNNNLKKVISSVAAFAVVASTATAFAGFPDVDESASYAGAVDTLTALGIVEGDDNGKFNPDNSVTRAEFAKMVVEARGEGAAAESQTVSQFTDSQNHWAVGYIAQGVSDGFINGYDDTTFGPDDTVTYAQAVKMLVCAIGYDSRAQLIGGWPTGYLSYGGTLGIINGVTGVGSDTALTRAQCAVLINNTLRAPLVVFGDLNYGGLTGTVPQQSTVVKDGVGKDWQTLLTNNHNAYAVRGRVTATSKTGAGLDADQVKFKVESAENFDGNEVGTKVEYTPTEEVYVGSTKAADMLFTYADAIIQKDKDTDEYKFISITPYGANKTETFAASDISDDDSTYKTEERTQKVDGEDTKVEYKKYSQLAVYKTSTSSSTNKYKLASDAALYVNGVEVTGEDSFAETALVDKVLKDNISGTVTLIDETETGSTSTDGYYDYILVDYYATAVVDSVSENSSYNRIFFKNGDEIRLQWEVDDEDVEVSFTKDGSAIDYKDLATNDVLSIKYDVEAGFNASSFYEVTVAQNTVTGVVSKRNDADKVIVIDGNEYEAASYITINDKSFVLGTEYTLYLDAFGNIAGYEEGSTSKNYGVVVAMYQSAGSDYPTVKIIKNDGTVADFTCKDDKEANKFFAVFNGVDPESDEGKALVYDGKSYTKSDIVSIENNVCTYSTTSTGVKLTKYMKPRNDANSGLTFKASANKLGSYTISDSVSNILDVANYVEDGEVSKLTVSSFTDDSSYETYVYDDKASDGSYKFVLILSGTTDVNPETVMAMVVASPSLRNIDGTDYCEVPVVRDGEDGVNILFEGDSVDLNEGDVIVCTVDANGVADDYTLIYSAPTASGKATYNALFDAVVANDNFALTLEEANAFSDITKNEWFKTTETKRAKAYFGPIYEKSSNNIELFVGQEDGQSSILDNVASFTVDNSTKSYVYDYNFNEGNSARVSLGNVTASNSSIYRGTYTDENEEYVSWDKVKSEGNKPNFALVKTVNDDVTEIIYFVAN